MSITDEKNHEKVYDKEDVVQGTVVEDHLATPTDPGSPASVGEADDLEEDDQDEDEIEMLMEMMGDAELLLDDSDGEVIELDPEADLADVLSPEMALSDMDDE
mmetsp:Transcript_17729/g.30012  ORF Transcript_17729/g.30012 Transcript_17729/m.30012 type:complete len:103 (+) Transcript_17729:118-426(+)